MHFANGIISVICDNSFNSRCWSIRDAGIRMKLLKFQLCLTLLDFAIRYTIPDKGESLNGLVYVELHGYRECCDALCDMV